MQDTATIQIGQVRDVRLVRLAGRGTYTQSERFHEIVEGFFQQCDRQVVVDLNGCTYLDSTFLGCLVRLCRQHHAPPDKRFVIVATDHKQQQLFASSQLHRFLIFDDTYVATADVWSEVEVTRPDAKQLGRHVMKCHRTIGELEIPDADKFAEIAKDLESELPPKA